MVAESLFVMVDDDVASPTEFARGPWDPSALHGGPVAALVAHGPYRWSGCDSTPR